MSKHREINCPVCPGPVCEKDGAGPETVWLLLYESKHLSVWECPLVYSTEEKANEAAGQCILEDIGEDRYCDAPEVVKNMQAAIEARDWPRLWEVHDGYWSDFMNPDRYEICECPVSV